MKIRGSYIILSLIGITSGLLIWAIGAEFILKFIYNPSQSAPTGFYFISQKLTPDVGDYILIELPVTVKKMAVERQYVGPDIPLLKKVFATSGDHICSKAGQIYVNHKPVTKVKTHDPSGRILPVWDDCRVLKKGEYFLLSLHSDYSFDSRYFGPVMQNQIIGVATYF